MYQVSPSNWIMVMAMNILLLMFLNSHFNKFEK